MWACPVQTGKGSVVGKEGSSYTVWFGCLRGVGKEGAKDGGSRTSGDGTEGKEGA
jgi:hypothetical protein